MDNMTHGTTDLEINSLFANDNPDEVWGKTVDVIRRISPSYDFTFIHTAFNDVVCLFRGEYPGYCRIKTLYHDLRHTMDIFLCAARLLHGVHISGNRMDDDAITLISIAALMHDIGYAQRQNEENGTGAQYTQSHIRRGIEFMRQYLADRHFPPSLNRPLEAMIHCTNFDPHFHQINFPDQRTRLLGQILGSADLVGQMADRTYLEKLLLLYMEFEEAHFGNYRSMHELLSKTRDFYAMTLRRLNDDFGGVHHKLAHHFRDSMGVERDFYMESIEKNIGYLSQVISLDKSQYLSMLKRGGIVEMVKNLADPLALA